jgi:dienelactone hydrolase
VALAVDPLSRRGGTASFASPDAARIAVSAMTGGEIIADLAAARAYLQFHPSVRKDQIRIARDY